jgi:glycosyltransferase involved in cell wall biosynthesis
MARTLKKAQSEARTNPDLLFSVVIPCFNEERSIESTILEIEQSLVDAPPHELIVVDDCSTDGTAEILNALGSTRPNFKVVRHNWNRGYGAALKSGIRAGLGQLIAITDADGTYPNERLLELVELCRDRDMVVGARVGQDVVYSRIRAFPKYFLKKWVSMLARQPVPDINSGMRVFRKDIAERFFGILPNGFSFTITITLATLTTFRNVQFVPISYKQRIGKSHIRPFADTFRFMQIILRTGVYFAPIRAFLPIFSFLMLLGMGSLVYDVIWLENLTDKTIMFFLFAMNTGMFILLSDMVDKRLGD